MYVCMHIYDIYAAMIGKIFLSELLILVKDGERPYMFKSRMNIVYNKCS